MSENKFTVDKIFVDENGVIFYTESKNVLLNNGLVDKEYRRMSLAPSTNVEHYPKEILDVVNKTWTEEIFTKYKQSLSKANTNE